MYLYSQLVVEVQVADEHVHQYILRISLALNIPWGCVQEVYGLFMGLCIKFMVCVCHRFVGSLWFVCAIDLY